MTQRFRAAVASCPSRSAWSATTITKVVFTVRPRTKVRPRTEEIGWSHGDLVSPLPAGVKHDLGLLLSLSGYRGEWFARPANRVCAELAQKEGFRIDWQRISRANTLVFIPIDRRRK